MPGGSRQQPQHGHALPVPGQGPAEAQRIDCGGRTVIPGLIDSHMHIIRGGLNYNMELRWDGVPLAPCPALAVAGRQLVDGGGVLAGTRRPLVAGQGRREHRTTG